MGTYRYVVYGTAPLEMQPGDFWWGRKTSTFAIEVARNLSRGHAKWALDIEVEAPRWQDAFDVLDYEVSMVPTAAWTQIREE
jgi:hypothetical protein